MSLKKYLNRIILQSGVLLWYFVMLTSIAVNLKNVHQRITEILSFDLNHDFSQFPKFIKMQQPTCDCSKI